jgi:hypothetical protein
MGVMPLAEGVVEDNRRTDADDVHVAAKQPKLYQDGQTKPNYTDMG